MRGEAEAAGLKTQTVDSSEKALEGFVALERRKRARQGAPASRRVSQALKPYTNVGAATSQGVTHRAGRPGPARHRRARHHRRRAVGLLRHRDRDRRRRAADGPRRRRHPHRRPAARGRDRRSRTTRPAAAPTRAARCSRSSTTSRRGRRSASPPPTAGELELRRTTSARSADPSGPCGADVDRRRRRLLRRAVLRRRRRSPTRSTTSPRRACSTSPRPATARRSRPTQAPLRIIAPDEAGDRRTSTSTGVDPSLYAGGFQDFDPGAGADVAQDDARSAIRPATTAARRHPRPPVGRPDRPERRRRSATR